MADNKVVFDTELDEKGLTSGLNAVESKTSGALGRVGSVVTAGVAAAGAAVVALTKKSIENYAEYEQLSGGVMKLYGNMGQSLEEYAASVGKNTEEVAAEWQKLENAQNLVLQNADNAFKTAQMSANQYLEIATSFSATLINDLGGDSVKAAELTDVAVTAIADNWNTFGGDINMISYAFTGFAKNNFAMLDNLKLGYAGSRSEMERLIADANEYAAATGRASNLTIDSFGDIVQAIQLVQEKQNIAGTSAREAATTIQGSLQMTKAAWENLTTALADPKADIGAKVNQLTEAVGSLLANIIPAATRALTGIIESVGTLVLKIGEMLPSLLQELLPPLIEAIMSLIMGLMDAMPEIIAALVAILPTLIQGICDGILSHIGEVILAFINLFLAFVKAIPDIIAAIVDNLPLIISSIVEGLLSHLPELIMAAVELFMALIIAIPQIIIKLVEAGPRIIQGIIEGLVAAAPQLLESAKSVWERIVEAMQTLPGRLMEKGQELIQKVINGITVKAPQLLQDMLNLGVNVINFLWNGLANAFPSVANFLSDVFWNIVHIFDGIWNNMLDIGSNIIWGIWNGITGALGAFWDNIYGFCSDLVGTIQGWLGIASPSKVMRDMVGKNIALGIYEGFAEVDVMGQIADDVKNGVPSIAASATVAMEGMAMQQTTQGQESLSKEPVVLNFYDTQTSPSAIYQKFYSQQTYGMAREL